MKHKLSIIILYLILPLILASTSALALVTPALADEPSGDQAVFGRDLTLKPGEKIEGNVAVFGGSVTVPAESEIDGDLVVFGGQAEIDGKVTGNIGMIGGNIRLGNIAVVEGDIGMVGGKADIAKGAKVEGKIEDIDRFGFDDDHEQDSESDNSSSTSPVSTPSAPPAPSAPSAPSEPWESTESTPANLMGKIFDFFGYMFGYTIFLLALVGVSWLVAAFMPEQMKITGDTLAESAPLSFGLGLLTMVSAVMIGVVLAITICLAFIPILAFIALGIATLFGWIVIGQLIGERLLIASGRSYPSLVGSTLLGVTVLTVVTKMPVLEMVPCLGVILWILGGILGTIVSLTGLGAVILTRFGTRPYPQPGSSFQAGPAPTAAPMGGSSGPRSGDLSPLERSEAELRAKIKAALAEADAAKATPPGETPESKPPAGEEPTPADKPEPKSPEDDPDQAPKTDA